MKLNLKFVCVLSLLSIVVFFNSCDNQSNDEKGQFKDLSPQAQNYFKMSRNNGAGEDGLNSSFRPGNPANSSFQKLYNKAASAGRTAGDSTTINPDTTIYVEPWTTCAKITTTQNSDGSTTTVVDYGDGCEEGNDIFKYWMTGKYTYTYHDIFSFENNVYKDKYSYSTSNENYGGRYTTEAGTNTWLSNGTSAYEGSSEYNMIQNSYNGNYTGRYDYTYSWNDATYAYKGNSKSSYSEKKFVVEQNTYEYSSGSDYYKTNVLEPLVMRYDCDSRGNLYAQKGDTNGSYCFFPTYVSGREFIRYKQGDKEGSFEIYYGDGTCDDIIVIIENGKQIEIDLSAN